MSSFLLMLVFVFCVQDVCFAGNVRVTREKRNFVAENNFYRINFSKTASINEIIFKDSCKGIKSNYLSHDSLTLNSSKNFYLRENAIAEGSIKEISKTEKQLVFRVSYPKTPSNVVADYVYTFYADKPIIKVDILMRQDKNTSWLLIRLNEFGINNGFFSDWAVGEDEKSGSLSKDTKDQKATNWKKSYNWSALFTDESALGIIGLDKNSQSFIHIYGPKKQYINGKFSKWNSKEIALKQYLYIGPSYGGYKQVREWAQKLASKK